MSYLPRFRALQSRNMSATTPPGSLPRLPILEAVASHDPDSTAVIHSLSGRKFTYGELLGDVWQARDSFREACGKDDMNGQRIAFLVENSYDYVGESQPQPVSKLALLPSVSLLTYNSDLTRGHGCKVHCCAPVTGIPCP